MFLYIHMTLFYILIFHKCELITKISPLFLCNYTVESALFGVLCARYTSDTLDAFKRLICHISLCWVVQKYKYKTTPLIEVVMLC